MIAPIDATASLEVGGETLTLQLNMRTLALAAQGGVDLLAMKEGTQLTPYMMATMLAAFARPAHPDFTEDHALALMVRDAKASAGAVTKLLADFSAAAGEAGGTPAARPRRPRRKAG